MAVDQAGSISAERSWKGYGDRVQEGSWTCASGLASGCTRWPSGEPNSVGNEECMKHFRFGWDTTLNEERRDSASTFIGESD